MLKFRCVYPFSGHCKVTLLDRWRPMAVVFARLCEVTRYRPAICSKIAVPPSCHGPSEEGKARYKYKNLPNTVSRTGSCNVPHPVGATSSSPVRYLFVYPKKSLSYMRTKCATTYSTPAWPLSKILPFFLRPGARGRGSGKGDNMNDRLSVYGANGWITWAEAIDSGSSPLQKRDKGRRI